jgi:serine/threonine protein kinase
MNPDIPGLEDVVEIGQGGFATVYRAYQPTFRRTVAIKVLNAGNLDELAQERFRRGAPGHGSAVCHRNLLRLNGKGGQH